MSRVGKNTVASVATMMCIVFIMSIVLPLPAQAAGTQYTVSGAYNDQTGWYIHDDSGHSVTITNGSGDIFYKLDSNVSYTKYDGSFPIFDGTHTLYYYSGTEQPKSAIIKVDNTLPIINVTINGKANATTGYYNGTNTVNLTAYDNCSGVQYPLSYSFDGSTWINYTTSNITLLDGDNTLYARCFDKAGNVNISSTEVKVFNPDISVDQEINKWYAENVTIRFSYPTPEVDHIDYMYKDGNTWYQSPPPIFLGNEGNVTIYYRAVGENGISDLRSMWFGVDRNPPTVDGWIEGSQSSTGWWNGDVTVHINAHGGGISYTQYSFDNKTWTNTSNANGGTVTVSHGSSKTMYFHTTDMIGREAWGKQWIYFAPGSYNQGSMSDSVWINGVLYGPSSGTSDESETPETPTMTPTDVPWPTPTQAPSPTPETETDTGTGSPLALAVLIGVAAIIIVAAAAAYFFMLKPK